MNVTTFKDRLLSLNLNKVERRRVLDLTAKGLMFDLRTYTTFTEITEVNYKQVWFELNKKLAREDKFHRAQTHSMRSSKGFHDYGHLAYNNSSDDL